MALVFFVGCNNDTKCTKCKNAECTECKDLNYTIYVDASNVYTEHELTEEQKSIYPSATIHNYYSRKVDRDTFEVFRVIAHRGFHSTLEHIILTKNNVVERIVGINIIETPDYGTLCYENKFLSQFYGINIMASDFLDWKSNPIEEGDILLISRATTTSKGVISTVNACSALVKSFVK